MVWTVVAFAALVGAIGLAAGWLIGAGIARWVHHQERAIWIAIVAVLVLLTAVGIQQVSAVRTVPRSPADARAHDYSLAGLDQGLIVWTCGVNALTAVVALGRRGKREARPGSAGRHADERT